ncbi:MAG: hypothetical protein AAB426_00530 [Myxococcota bacterium]
MSTTDTVVDALRELATAANPGVVRKSDIAGLEEQLDEIEELLEEIEAKLEERDAESP